MGYLKPFSLFHLFTPVMLAVYLKIGLDRGASG
jgi:hypothetical protein